MQRLGRSRLKADFELGISLFDSLCLRFVIVFTEFPPSSSFEITHLIFPRPILFSFFNTSTKYVTLQHRALVVAHFEILGGFVLHITSPTITCKSNSSDCKATSPTERRTASSRSGGVGTVPPSRTDPARNEGNTSPWPASSAGSYGDRNHTASSHRGPR